MYLESFSMNMSLSTHSACPERNSFVRVILGILVCKSVSSMIGLRLFVISIASDEDSILNL